MKQSKRGIRLRVSAGMLALWLVFSAVAVLWEVSVQRERELQSLGNMLIAMAENVEYDTAYYRDKEPNNTCVFPLNNTVERNAQFTWMLNAVTEGQDYSVAIYDENSELQAISDTVSSIYTFLPDRFGTSDISTMATADFRSYMTEEAWDTLLSYHEKNKTLSTLGIESDQIESGSIYYLVYATLWTDGATYIPNTVYVYPCVWLKGDGWHIAVNANSMDELSIEESESFLGKNIEIQVIGSTENSTQTARFENGVRVQVTGEPSSVFFPEENGEENNSFWKPVWTYSCTPNADEIKDMGLCHSSSIYLGLMPEGKASYLELLRSIKPNANLKLLGDSDRYEILSEEEELLILSGDTYIQKRGFFVTEFFTSTTVYTNRDTSGFSLPYFIASTGRLHPLKNAGSTIFMTLGISFLLFLMVGVILSVQMGKILDQRLEMEIQRRQTTNAIAHDLKTPMAAILGLSENLMEHTKPEKEAHYIASIRQQTLRMNDIVMKMLELSRLEAEVDTVKYETFSLKALAQQGIAPYADRDQMFLITGDTNITADREMLLRVLDNLISNAVKHTQPGGVIQIAISPNRCEVWNPGDPIPEDVLPKLWQAYYQADDARSSGGSGLGLTIVKAILDRHGFHYGAENREDGVVFYFTW